MWGLVKAPRFKKIEMPPGHDSRLKLRSNFFKGALIQTHSGFAHASSQATRDRDQRTNIRDQILVAD